MSSYIVLWLDHDQASIYDFKTQEPEITHMHNRHHMNHHNVGRQVHEKLEEQKKFFHEVQDKVLVAKGVLILGPSTAKHEFVSYVKDHHGKGLADRILGVETMDKASDNQIVALSRKYFHKLNLFEPQV